MDNSFAKNILQLRSQRGLSQKQVAGSLGISQALLSHYEKGVRECGLDFLVKIADFYGVTTDFLLGRTHSAQGTVSEESHSDKSPSSILKYRRSAVACIDVIYDILNRCQHTQLTDHVADYLSLALYRILRVIYTANSDQPDEPFEVSKYLYSALNDASMRISSCMFEQALHQKDGNFTFLSLSADVMQQSYDKKWNSVRKVITRAEQKMAFGQGNAEK